MLKDLISLADETLFSQYSSQFGYIGIFLFFVTVDQITPIPEEVTLLTIGYLSFNHVFNPFIAGAVALTAFVTVDIVYFFLARSGNKFIKRITSGNKKTFIAMYKEKLKTHFGPTLLVLCFIPRMRMFGPVFAGMMNLSFKRFLLFDSLGLTLFTTVYLSLGMIFHKGLHSQMQKLEGYQHYIFTAAMVVLAVLIIVFIRRARQK